MGMPARGGARIGGRYYEYEIWPDTIEQWLTATWSAASLASVEVVKHRDFFDEWPKLFRSLGLILESAEAQA